MSIEVDGRVLETDKEGYLARREDWSQEVARAMARLDGCELGEGHWEVINFLREYYREHQGTPPMRLLVRNLGHRFGREKANTRFVYQLFPDGPARQACRYAGLPKPTRCL